MPNGLTLLVQENHAVPVTNLFIAFRGGLVFETTKDAGISSLMSTIFVADPARGLPTRREATGNFKRWARLRQPPDAVSAASGTACQTPGSGSEVIVSDGSAAGGVAANLVRPEICDGNLRWWRGLGGIRQHTILFSLVRSLLVVMPAEVS